MSPVDLLFVPAALVFISLLLAGMAWFEKRVVSAHPDAPPSKPDRTSAADHAERPTGPGAHGPRD